MDKPTLQTVLGQRGDKLTVSAQVYFDSQLVFISGYRPDGGTWVRFSYDERIELALPALDQVFQKYGWALECRPVKQPGLARNYMLVRAGETNGYSALQISSEAQEKFEQNERMAQFAAWDAYQVEVLGANS